MTKKQRRNRLILRRAMLAAGFKGLETEWWHFTLRDEPFPETFFDFPVAALVAQRLTSAANSFSSSRRRIAP